MLVLGWCAFPRRYSTIYPGLPQLKPCERSMRAAASNPGSAGFTMAKSQNEDRAKDRDRRHEQHQHANIQISRKHAVSSQRRFTHHALGLRRSGKQYARRQYRQNGDCWGHAPDDRAQHAANDFLPAPAAQLDGNAAPGIGSCREKTSLKGRWRLPMPARLSESGSSARTADA